MCTINTQIDTQFGNIQIHSDELRANQLGPHHLPKYFNRHAYECVQISSRLLHVCIKSLVHKYQVEMCQESRLYINNCKKRKKAMPVQHKANNRN